MCAADPKTDPRPNRMIRWLKDDFNVTVIGRDLTDMDGVKSMTLSESSSQNRIKNRHRNHLLQTVVQEERKIKFLTQAHMKVLAVMGKIKYYGLLLLRTHARRISLNLEKMKKIRAELQGSCFDVIISHDLSLLPLAWDLSSNGAKILLDAREYYPRNYDDQWRWRLFEKPFNIYLCKKYLRRCHKIVTVSEGLAQEYGRDFQVSPEVVMSMPDYQDIRPVQTKSGEIKMIYHGLAGYSRRTEGMVELMDYLDDRFSLDLMLLETKDAYWYKLVSMAAERKNVRIIPPVQMKEIVRFTNSYDIGLFLVPPTNFNLKYVLPNKFFEFIQARLAVAIGPSIEMKKIIERYGCGVVSRDFNPRSLAERLNELTADTIMGYKEKSALAAKVLCAETNRQRMLQIVDEMTATG